MLDAPMDVDVDLHSQILPPLTPSGAGEGNMLPLRPSSDVASLSAPPRPDVPRLTQSGRPRRDYRLPQRFHDILPEPPTSTPAPSILELQEGNASRRVLLIVRDRLITASNSFGIWRDYPDRPSTDPDATLTLIDLSNRHHPTFPDQSESTALNHPLAPSNPQLRVTHWPFPNPTIYAVMQWLNNGKTSKSELEITHFIQNVILAPTFSCRDLIGFNAHRENQRLDKMLREESKSKLRSQLDFIQSSVEILVPSGKPYVDAIRYQISGLLHRKLTHVILDAFNGPLAHLLHYSPFKIFQKNLTTGADERIYGEIYTSDAFLEETEKVRRSSPADPDSPGCKHEKVVAALMLSSDATHLTDFGNAKAWPIYLMLGNLSKYIRAQPNSGAMYHLAYIPSVGLYFSKKNPFNNRIFPSFLSLFKSLLRASIPSGEAKKHKYWLTVAAS
jgi:hypothetical protein